MTDEPNIIRSDRLRGVPRSSAGAGASDQYEAGTLSPLTRQGRYKVFATPFAARPVVTITPMRSAVGTVFPVFAGTPNTGSFQARLVATGAAVGAGSVNAFYIAMGPR